MIRKAIPSSCGNRQGRAKLLWENLNAEVADKAGIYHVGLAKGCLPKNHLACS